MFKKIYHVSDVCGFVRGTAKIGRSGSLWEMKEMIPAWGSDRKSFSLMTSFWKMTQTWMRWVSIRVCWVCRCWTTPNWIEWPIVLYFATRVAENLRKIDRLFPALSPLRLPPENWIDPSVKFNNNCGRLNMFHWMCQGSAEDNIGHKYNYFNRDFLWEMRKECFPTI